MNKNHLFLHIVLKNFKSHFRELIILIICEAILVAVVFAEAVGYQMFSNAHSSETFLQEDGISRVFVSAGMVLLFCGLILIITVLISYLGKRIPEYMLLKRIGISNADLRKMVLLEAGITYLLSIMFGFLIGMVLSYVLKNLILYILNMELILGKVSFLTYPLICLFTLLIYVLGFLLVKELQSDFLIITNTQETTRKEKLIGRLTVTKIILGMILCFYSVVAYSKLYHYENAFLIGLFFAGLYLAGRNGIALLLNYIRKNKAAKYYKNLLMNHRFYYRPNTISRYILFFSLISFLGCFYFGFQAISIIEADEPDRLYPYDFMCIADDEDDTFFEELQEQYQITLETYPMVRVANQDKTERTENGSEMRIQGQQIGISETTYHELRKRIDPSYSEEELGLDEKGERVYIVHQQDTFVKAQPVDWFYNKKAPDLHIGIPCIYNDFANKNGTYYEKEVAGEEIRSLTGCYSTPKCENLVVFSDEYFESAREEWKNVDSMTGYTADVFRSWYGDEMEPSIIQGPTKLVLVCAEANDVDEIDQKMERLEEQHQYIGRYDSTVKFHYSTKTAITDLRTERAVRLLVCIYIMGILMIVNWIMLYSMRQMERKEKSTRELFLAQMGMTDAERKKMNRREWYIFFTVPMGVLIAATIMFLKDTFMARMYQDDMVRACGKGQLCLLAAWILLNGVYFLILSKVIEKEAGTDGK